MAVIRRQGFRFRLDLTVVIPDTLESPGIQELDSRALAVGVHILRGMTPVITITTHQRYIDIAIIITFSQGIITCIGQVTGIPIITDKRS